MLEEDGAANVGKAAHITAASPRGPRREPSLTPQQRAAIANGVWLCAICADKVDKDPTRYPRELLRKWKAQAEQEAERRMGKPKAPEKITSARERQIKRDLKLREKMRREFLRPYDPALRPGTYRRPYERFITPKVIIHSTEDTTYPDAQKEPDPGKLSGWFRVEPYDFYHGGLMVIVWGSRGIMDAEGRWATIGYKEKYDDKKFREVTIWTLGKIPWRNIVTYDLHGDEYYNEPHLYCLFADNGQPHEGYAYVHIGDEYDWLLHPDRQLRGSGEQ